MSPELVALLIGAAGLLAWRLLTYLLSAPAAQASAEPRRGAKSEAGAAHPYGDCGSAASGSFCGACTSKSVAVSTFLRHRAPDPQCGVDIAPDGYVRVAALLAWPALRGKLTGADLRAMVERCPKQRFSIVERPREPPSPALEPWVRANQGHSYFEGSRLDPSLMLSPVLSAADAPTAVHGTSRASLELITASGGLKPMGRTHVHFARGLPGEDGVISGMRARSQVHLYLNVPAALREGLALFKSSNGVILTPGNRNGLVPMRLLRERPW
jgi:2'-phosphotransferase